MSAIITVMHSHPTIPVLWGKTGPDGQWLPLIQHLADVSGAIPVVAGKLIAARQQSELGNRSSGDFTTILQFAAWAHDVGKASVAFQSKAPDLYARVRSTGMPDQDLGCEAATIPHGVVSAHTTTAWLRVRATGRVPNRVNGWADILGGHHGTFNPRAPRPDALVLEPPEWEELRFALLDAGAAHLGLTTDDITDLARLTWDTAVQDLVTGTLIAADWIGSDTRNFPLIPTDASVTSIDQQERKAAGTDAAHGVLGQRWTPEDALVTDDYFRSRFALPDDAALRPAQQAALDAVNAAIVATGKSGGGDTATTGGIVVIEDATGEGKTEAALIGAQLWASRTGRDGMFFAQPTQVTSDAMFDRVLNFLDSGDGTGGPASVVLAHGKAVHNPAYSDLQRTVKPSGVFDDATAAPEHTHAEALAWFSGRKTGLLASVVVGTIDQLLMASLRSRHLVLRHLGLAGKVVIIDEIHAADDYMSVYLHRALEWLGALGVPVIALSATLPAQTREGIISAYARGAAPYSDDCDLPEEPGYPRISWWAGGDNGTLMPPASERRRSTTVTYLDSDRDVLADAVIASVAPGGCAGVVCNTVSRAQELYRKVTAATDADVVLLHSRFTAPTRRTTEERLVGQLGRNGDRPERLIVISTQIIEQGLDLDFDILYTDIAPLDLLIQRMGRLHRHVRPRPAHLTSPTLVIAGVERTDTAPRFPRGVELVYRRSRLLRATAVLDDHLAHSGGVVTSPDDVASLVCDAYSAQATAPDGWEEVWESAESAEDTHRRKAQLGAQSFLLPGPGALLAEWGGVNAADSDEVGAAQVRDADASLEVVLLQDLGDGSLRIPGGASVDLMTPAGAFTAARNTLRLPAWVSAGSAAGELQDHRPAGWQDSPMLRGTLPLILSVDFTAELGDWELTYDLELGLLMQRSRS